jgi:hypothetical protein
MSKPESQKTTYPQTSHTKCAARVAEFYIACPGCEEPIELTYLTEQSDTSFEPELDEKFIDCPDCGALIEVVGVKIIATEAL